ncbi:MAG: nucleotide exchange factor GrpE [Firmicutes bacterium]|nr:nucleotide exchange factor GrpE [Bacillota bacterium]
MTEEYLNEDIKKDTKDTLEESSNSANQPEDLVSGDDQNTNNGNTEELEELKAKLRQTEEEAQNYLAQLTRMQADFINFRRRVERERSEQVKYANEQLLLELLPVVDNLERAIAAGEGAESPGPLVEGVAQVLKQFLAVLAKEGVTPIDPGIGEPFNPEYQEALMREEGEAEVVVEELLRGWRYHDRVLRPTLVKVGPRSLIQVEPEIAGDVETSTETVGNKEVARENG